MTADTHHEDLRGASLKNDPSNRSTPSVPAEGVVNERYLRILASLLGSGATAIPQEAYRRCSAERPVWRTYGLAAADVAANTSIAAPKNDFRIAILFKLRRHSGLQGLTVAASSSARRQTAMPSLQSAHHGSTNEFARVIM
jgi:hypothetical protein